jgi:hypothetical protein
VSNIKKAICGKTFGEDIGELIHCGDKFDNEILAKNLFSHKLEINLNMFGSSMEDRIGGNS